MKIFARRPIATPGVSRQVAGDGMPYPRLERFRSQLAALLRNDSTSLQPKANPGGADGVTPALAERTLTSDGGGRPLSKSGRHYFQPRLGADFSQVSVHSDSRAAGLARSLHARAFTLGNHIVFGAGRYPPASPAGRKLMAHELTHVVQQGGGGGAERRGVIQRRRMPAQTELEDLVRSLRPSLGRRRANLAIAHRAGLARLVAMALEEMKPPERGEIGKAARPCLASRRRYGHLPRGVKKNLCLAIAISKKHPLGEPKKYQVPAGTHANMRTLYNNALKYMQMVYSGNRYDTSIHQVFGTTAGTLQVVKTSFQFARRALETLYLAKSVFIDESGYRREVGIPGEGSATSLSLSSHLVNKPNDPYSIAVTIHESLHAGNTYLSGDPGGYNDGNQGFREVSDTLKLKNADHYTVIAWRIFAPNDPRAHGAKTFTPARRVRGRAAAATLTPLVANTMGADRADEQFVKAMNVANDLHELYREIYVSPILWTMATSKTGATAKATYQNTLPYWSKVENMTLHRKGAINRVSTDPRLQPVSVIDIAISEGVVRKLNLARSHIPNTPAKMQAFLKRATAGERRAASGNVAKTQSLIVGLILRTEMKDLFGHGSHATDLKALNRLVGAYAKDYSLILKKRDPNSFT